MGIKWVKEHIKKGQAYISINSREEYEKVARIVSKVTPKYRSCREYSARMTCLALSSSTYEGNNGCYYLYSNADELDAYGYDRITAKEFLKGDMILRGGHLWE